MLQSSMFAGLNCMSSLCLKELTRLYFHAFLSIRRWPPILEYTASENLVEFQDLKEIKYNTVREIFIHHL